MVKIIISYVLKKVVTKYEESDPEDYFRKVVYVTQGVRFLIEGGK